MWRHRRAQLGLIGVTLAITAVAVWIAGRPVVEQPELMAEVEASATKPLHEDKRVVSESTRAELLARAQVWRTSEVPVSRAIFSKLNLDEVSCRFKVSELGGTTPKFDCVLDTGEEIRIKYGNGPEVPTEAAATRLLAALGFGADQLTLVKTLRCYGCPEEPFSMMKAVELTRADPLFKQVIDYGDFEEFQWVGLERKLAARPIETDRLEGWAMFELDTVDERKGGSSRAHVDALRLMAVFLAHWDNKSDNQRLVCLDRQWPEDKPCARPFLLLQDVGATFGPVKMDLEAWKRTALWEDRPQCSVSMHGLPFNGATFGRVTITEAGRLFLGKLLSQLSDEQLRDLFADARFAEKRGLFNPTSSISAWVDAFHAKVRAINDGPPCPLS